MSDDRENEIRKRAHKLWEAAGRPEGDHEAHWQKASQEADAEQGGATPDAQSVAGAGPALAKHSKDAVPAKAIPKAVPKGEIDPKI